MYATQGVALSSQMGPIYGGGSLGLTGIGENLQWETHRLHDG